MSRQSALVLGDHDLIYVRADAPIWSDEDIDAYVDQLACLSQVLTPDTRMIFDYGHVRETPLLSSQALATISGVAAAFHAIGLHTYVRIVPEPLDPIVAQVQALSEAAGVRVRNYRTLDDAFAGPELRDRVEARALIDAFFDGTT